MRAHVGRAHKFDDVVGYRSRDLLVGAEDDAPPASDQPEVEGRRRRGRGAVRPPDLVMHGRVPDRVNKRVVLDTQFLSWSYRERIPGHIVSLGHILNLDLANLDLAGR